MYKFILLLISSFVCKSVQSQSYDWTDSDFSDSYFRTICEKDGRYYGALADVFKESPDSNYTISLEKFNFESLESPEFLLENFKDFGAEDHFSTQAIKYISQVDRWMMFQYKILSENHYTFRVMILDSMFNVISQNSVDVPGHPLNFYMDSDEFETYLLGSVAAPPANKLIYLKYNHSKPDSLPLIQVTQATPRPMFFISSMRIDQQTRNMLVFSYNGISVLDSNLVQLKDLNVFDISTYGHGDILGDGSKYYSHSTQDSSPTVQLRKLVVQKYDTSFHILAADTLGWPNQDNYPFTYKSIDSRNGEILVGGHLDGPLTHFFLDASIKKYYLAKYDKDLNLIWYKEYGGDKAYIFFGLHLLEDGTCLAYGAVADTITRQHHGYVIHVDSNGGFLSSYTSPQEWKSPIQVVNPGNESFQIFNSESISATLRLYDLTGCLLNSFEIDSQTDHFDVSSYPSGLYVYAIIQKGDLIQSGKWFKGN